jgi:hypothetical protein
MMQHMPAQTGQHYKQQVKQNSKNTAKHIQQHHTHSRGLLVKVVAVLDSQKGRVLAHCCSCG